SRMARNFIEEIVRAISKPAKPTGASIHRARKHGKKVRALLKLIRKPLRDADFCREKDELRRLGRMFSSARDAEVSLVTFKRIVHPAGSLHSKLVRPIQARLARDFREELRK